MSDTEAIAKRIVANAHRLEWAIQCADITLEFVDAKGGGPIDEKSRVKCKCAAEKFPWFVFVIAQKQAKKAGGGWSREEF